MPTLKHDVPQELLASLLANYKKPEDLIGENGLLKQLVSSPAPWTSIRLCGGGGEGIDTVKQTLVLHADNGSPMKSATLLATLQWLGVAPSYSRPRVSNDNPYAESFFRTCKYRPEWPAAGFASLDDARIWVRKFVQWYNEEHHHSGLNFVTPGQRHREEAPTVMQNRIAVYQAARDRNPGRWSESIRDWSLPETVWLNPEREKTLEMKKAA